MLVVAIVVDLSFPVSQILCSRPAETSTNAGVAEVAPSMPMKVGWCKSNLARLVAAVLWTAAFWQLVFSDALAEELVFY